MRSILCILAFAALTHLAQAQVLVVKTGADGKVFEPSPLTIPSGILTTPTITSPTISGAGTTITLSGTTGGLIMTGTIAAPVAGQLMRSGSTLLLYLTGSTYQIFTGVGGP